ncbi:hypothetical protein PIB30_106614, partial [Stylosanthes scabra]|nr:hypothetical protein [Stylosanthes scabra]
DGTIVTVYANHKEARRCYHANLNPPRVEPKNRQVAAFYNAECLPPLTELDPRTNIEDKPTPTEKLQKISLTSDPEKFTFRSPGQS